MRRVWVAAVLGALSLGARAAGGEPAPEAGTVGKPSPEMLQAVANRTQRLQIAPDRGLLTVLASVDGETGEHDKIARHLCVPGQISDEIEGLVSDEVPRMLATSAHAASDLKLQLVCSANGTRAICSGWIGTDDGGPSELQLVFSLAARGQWLLDAIVRRDFNSDQGYIDKQLRRSRSCASRKR